MWRHSVVRRWRTADSGTAVVQIVFRVMCLAVCRERRSLVTISSFVLGLKSARLQRSLCWCCNIVVFTIVVLWLCG